MIPFPFMASSFADQSIRFVSHNTRYFNDLSGFVSSPASVHLGLNLQHLNPAVPSVIRPFMSILVIPNYSRDQHYIQGVYIFLCVIVTPFTFSDITSVKPLNCARFPCGKNPRVLLVFWKPTPYQRHNTQQIHKPLLIKSQKKVLVTVGTVFYT